MQYLLDTNTVSDIARKSSSAYARYTSLQPSLLCVSAVTLKEIEYGRQLNPAGAQKFSVALAEIFEAVNILPFDPNDACASGRLRAELKRAGTPIGPYDVLIAGTALARQLTLVTANTREFSRVAGLRLENWRTPVFEVREDRAVYVVNRVKRAGAHLAA